MIWLEPTSDLADAPEHVAQVTVAAYRAQYGLFHGETIHLATLGIVPISVAHRVGYIWLSLHQQPTSRMLRSLRPAVQSFWAWNTWNLCCFVEDGDKRKEKFAEYCGFALRGVADGFKCYEVAQ